VVDETMALCAGPELVAISLATNFFTSHQTRLVSDNDSFLKPRLPPGFGLHSVGESIRSILKRNSANQVLESHLTNSVGCKTRVVQAG
jgi:hypothetical protein